MRLSLTLTAGLFCLSTFVVNGQSDDTSADWTRPEKCLNEFPMSMCRAYFIRYAWDNENSECVERVWGGCPSPADDANFFSTVESCKCECNNDCIG